MTNAPELEAPDFSGAEEPFTLFQAWLDEASATEINDANGMALGTVDEHGMPNVRMVLLKGVDGRNMGPDQGFVFYTNLESAKGGELKANPAAALLFHWKSLRRQVRVRGPVSAVTAQEADAYFASRPRLSRIGAWASQQSRPLESRFALETAVAKYTAKFGVGNVPRPQHWSGFRVTPMAMEFWHDRPFRLHDRIAFTREATNQPWTRTRLYP